MKTRHVVVTGTVYFEGDIEIEDSDDDQVAVLAAQTEALNGGGSVEWTCEVDGEEKYR